MKPLSFIFLSLCLSCSAQAETKNSLALSLWDFDAIKASHQFGSFKQQKNQTCTPNLKAISEFSQQSIDTLFSTDNCYVYTTSQEGWVTKYSLETMETLGKIRVGLKTANATLSKDNKILLIGNRQPADLVLLNTHDLSVARMIPVKNRKGILSPVSRVRTANDEQGFIVAPQDFPKIWKINYQNPAPIGFGDGWNHDYRCMKEHVNKSLFPIKRLKTGMLLEDFQIDNNGIFLVGKDKSGNGMIMDLDLSRVVAHPKIPSVNSGLTWKTKGSNHLATLNQNTHKINIYSNQNNPRHWNKTTAITVNQASSLTSCANSTALWVGTQDAKIQLIDKNTLKITKTLNLKNNHSINQIHCLQNGNAMLVHSKTNTIIFNSQTFEQIL